METNESEVVVWFDGEYLVEGGGGGGNDVWDWLSGEGAVEG
jgi:hypothetical protein